MDEKKRHDIALFRYGIIAPVLHGNVAQQTHYFRQVADKDYDVPHWGRKKYNPQTFKKWLKQYRRYGYEALVPREREDKGQSRKIDDHLKQAIKEAVDTYPFLSAAALYRLLLSEGTIRVGGINEGTVRKFVKDNGLREKCPTTARKKFEKEHINQLWTADCMHGPYIQLDAQPRKHKVFLIAAIDDHSRMICAAGWSTHENSIALETVLKNGIGRFGLPKTLYCDNGSLFSSSQLQLACARLGIALIHSKPYDSPSRGKIERFFRTVRQKFLQVLDLEEIKDLRQLNQRFEIWLEKEYHKHFPTGIGQTPMERFIADSKQTPIKRVSQEELDTAFQVTLYRMVKNDATISVNRLLYECPPSFIGKKIEVRYAYDKPHQLILYQQQRPLVQLKPCNPHENADVPALGISFTKGEKATLEVENHD